MTDIEVSSSHDRALHDLARGKDPIKRVLEFQEPVRKDLEYHQMLPLSRQLPPPLLSRKMLVSIDSGNVHPKFREYLIASRMLTAKGEPTENLLRQIEKQTGPFSGKVGYRQGCLLMSISSANASWHSATLAAGGLTQFRDSVALSRAGYFNLRTGMFSDAGAAIVKSLNDKNFAYLLTRYTSQHASLLNLCATYGAQLNESIYSQQGASKVPWATQQKRIEWMRKNGIIDDANRPTQLGNELRTARTPILHGGDFKEVHARVGRYLSENGTWEQRVDFGLGHMSPAQLESAIFRLKISGYLNDNSKPNNRYLEAVAQLKLKQQKEDKPAWIIEKRQPRLDELSDRQKLTLLTLASESPYLSEQQLTAHIKVTKRELTELKQGWLLNARNMFIPGAPNGVLCVALNNRKADAVLTQLGVKKPLNGRFQRDSNARHDLMLWESLQAFKAHAVSVGIDVTEVVHERAIYMQKTSANDNKGVATPDLIVRAGSGEEYAVEYGNYKVKDMIRKVTQFPQQNVFVFTSDAAKLQSYDKAFHAVQQPTKRVTWKLLPEIFL